MSITGLPVLILVACAAVGLPVLAVATWRRGRFRIARTALVLVLSQALAASAIGLVVNRQEQLFTSWSDLLGGAGSTVRHPAVPAGRLDARIAAQQAAAPSDHGVVLSEQLTGARSGISLPVRLYLPPQYARPGWTTHRFPVIEVLDGFPGSADNWLNDLQLAKVMDTEIAAGRMAPTIAVLPQQNLSGWHDSECVNAVRGTQMATYLTTDLRAALGSQLRVATDRSGWGTIGYSTGGFCAVNLAMQPPYGYAAAVSLSGYFAPITDSTTGDLYRGDTAARDHNDPDWLVRHAPIPGLSLYLAGSEAENGTYQQASRLATLADGSHGGVRATLAMVPAGGHNFDTWRILEVPALDWLSGRLAPPLAAPAVLGHPAAVRPAVAEGAQR